MFRTTTGETVVRTDQTISIGSEDTQWLMRGVTGERARTEEDRPVCYNCGCHMPDNDMGNPKNITNKTFQEAANAAGQSVEEAKKNTLELLEETLGKKK